HRLREGRLDLDDRGRLLAASGEDAARPAELHARTDLAHAVGQQRGGQRVTPEPLVLLPVEAEPERGGPVDGTGRGVAGHPDTDRISLVTVSRTAVNQRRQPDVWHQRSANGPLGLSRTNR